MNDGVTLKEYVDARFSDLHSAIESQRLSMEKRLDGMNEFRKTIEDLGTKTVTKEVFDVLVKQVQELRVTGGSLAGRQAGLAQWYGWIVAAVATALMFANLLRK